MTEGILLDTDVVSFFLKDDTRAKKFEPFLTGKLRSLSFMSTAELYRWALTRSWGPKRIEHLERTLEDYAVLPYDRVLGWTWARVVSTCSRHGLSIAPSDAWIAATACRHDLPLLTHNMKHFRAAEELCGLRLVVP